MEEKKMNVSKKVIWSVISFLLILFFMYLVISEGTGFSFIKRYNTNDYYTVYEEEFDMAQIENLDLSWPSGNANLYKHSENNIKVIQKSYRDLPEDELLDISVFGDTLHIKEQKKPFYFWFFGLGRIPSSLEVYLPEKVFNEISLACASGNLYLQDVNCNRLKSALSSGNMLITKLTSNTVELSISSGKFEIANVTADSLESTLSSGSINISGEIKELSLACSSGKISIDNNILPENLEATVSSGSVDISIPDNDGFQVNYSLSSGKFDTAFDLYSNLSDTNKKNVNAKYKNGGNIFYFKVNSGSIYLDKQ
jgi:lia operon protein LiaG